MIQLRSFLRASDKTAIVKVYCIKVLKSSKDRIAILGDLVVVCVNSINIKKFIILKVRFQKKFNVGSMHRALIIRIKVNYSRICGVLMKFNENSVVIVSKQVVPLSNKVYGPVMREFCMRWPSLGCVSSCII
jgi:large subunit ribosomal protein L14